MQPEEEARRNALPRPRHCLCFRNDYSRSRHGQAV